MRCSRGCDVLHLGSAQSSGTWVSGTRSESRRCPCVYVDVGCTSDEKKGLGRGHATWLCAVLKGRLPLQSGADTLLFPSFHSHRKLPSLLAHCDIRESITAQEQAHSSDSGLSDGLSVLGRSQQQQQQQEHRRGSSSSGISSGWQQRCRCTVYAQHIRIL